MRIADEYGRIKNRKSFTQGASDKRYTEVGNYTPDKIGIPR